MSTFEIVITVLIFVTLGVLLFYMFWNFQKFNSDKTKTTDSDSNAQSFANVEERVKQLQEDLFHLKDKAIKGSYADDEFGKSLDTLKANIHKIDASQNFNKEKIDKLLDQINNLNQQSQQNQTSSQNLNQRIETLNDIFISNYRRGKLGETTLNFILESMLGNNSDVVLKQYQMLNGNRPDVFLRGDKVNIPIDSKFPFENFAKMLKLDNKSLEYSKTLSELKQNIKKHLVDIAQKYISLQDNAQQAVMYIPSQPLFELIYSDASFSDLIKFSNEKNVWISGPNTLPVLLRAIDVFITDTKRSRSIKKIVFEIENLAKEFERFEERWKTFDNRVEGIVRDAKNISTTSKKINQKFKTVTNPKLVEGIDNTSDQESTKDNLTSN